MMVEQPAKEMCYDPFDTTLKFVSREDEITGDDYESLRAEMSCGHAATPESVKGWCTELLRQKKFKFTCPAETDDRMCGVEWSYQEVCKMALLTTKEMEEFEVTLVDLFLHLTSEIKKCPGCKSYVKRKDPSSLSVHCTMCSEIKGRPFIFCWQCLSQWKGPRPRADRCDNMNCTNEALELLRNCPETSINGCNNCPSIRACPTCGAVVKHNEIGCGNVTCVTCMNTFCFICLELDECEEQCCVAPRQTWIPTYPLD
ncbi:hypothetical protein UPYG_G00238730 [Umbra pygmaea]|uniref:RING-type domain-containing protein n=1 Tax=Umbra pygmaea TaxID=75934 RepID=A0ABD0X2P9_UMBPY